METCPKCNTVRSKHVCCECGDYELPIKNTIGKAAYDAYCATRKWKSYNGDPLPQWDGVKPEIQAGWVAAAEAVILYTRAYLEDSVVSDIINSMDDRKSPNARTETPPTERQKI